MNPRRSPSPTLTGLDQILETTANDIIAEIKAANYLGSSNRKPHCDLSGYFLNITRRWLYGNPRRQTALGTNQELFILAATIEAIGAGNCAELVRLLLLKLLMHPALSDQLKRSIAAYSYRLGDTDDNWHSYAVIGKRVYDIWAGKDYPISCIQVETGVPFSQHEKIDIAPIWFDADPHYIKAVYDGYLVRLSNIFEEQLNKDLTYNAFNPTLDNDNKTANVILVRPAFHFLYQKFLQTFADEYYQTHSDVAESIRSKIIKNYVLLISSLRQDIPMHPDYKDRFETKIKENDDTIKNALKDCTTNVFFVDYLMAVSYKSIDPYKANILFAQLEDDMSNNPNDDALTNWLKLASNVTPANKVDTKCVLAA